MNPPPPSAPAPGDAPRVDPAAVPLESGLPDVPAAGAALGGTARVPDGFLTGERVAVDAPRVDLAGLRLGEASSTPGADPVAARHVAEGAGHVVPKTPSELAREIDFLDADELTGAEIALLRRFLREGFPGERLVTPAQAREMRGHLGGQSIY